MAIDVLTPRPLTGPDDPIHSESATYRVVIRLERVRQNLSHSIGGRPTDAEVIRWLCGLGFIPATDGNAWLGHADTLARLNRSEIVRTEPVNEWYDCYPTARSNSDGIQLTWRSLVHAFQVLRSRLFSVLAPPL